MTQQRKIIDKGSVAKDIRTYVKGKRNFRNASLTSTIVAKELGIARSTLIKVMSEEFGMPFAQFLNQCRVRHARKLIMSSKDDASMEHIAVMSGYSTLHTFYKKYKEEYGELPRTTINNNNK